MENKPSNNNELDLVFLCDCTGSMSSYIQSAQSNIKNIMEKIQAAESRDARFALIAYRDHPPQEKSYIVQKFDFTNSIKTAKSNVDSMSANGGGDTPEAVSAAFRAALNLNYRKSATKIVIIVADAPPHGLPQASGDGFPNGDPDGSDALADAHVMAERGIVIYTVGVEPLLGGSPWAVEFFKALAKITGGRYIALGNAKILPDIIVGGAEEEIALEKLANALEEEKKAVLAEAEKQKETLSEDAMYDRVTSNLQSKGICTTQLEVDDISNQSEEDKKKEEEVLNEIVEFKTIKEFKEKFASRTSTIKQNSGFYFGAPTLATSAMSPFSDDIHTEMDFTYSSAAAPSSAAYSAPAYSSPSIDYACQSSAVSSKAINREQVARGLTRNSKRK